MHASQKIGLALSGGGYRAAAFHLGTLKKLNQLRLLQKVDVISTISGGSIIGAYYCLHDLTFEEFESNMYKTLETKSVIRYILTSKAFFGAVVATLAFFFLCYLVVELFTAWSLFLFLPLSFYLLGKFQFTIFPISKVIEEAYKKFFFNSATLSSLKDKPELAIGSTNLQTCRPFTFSKRKMEDSQYAYMNPPIKFNNKDFPIARAVAASTCVPNFFSPIKISSDFFVNVEDRQRATPVLVDGGVYDNQGIQKLTQRGSSYECDIVITSDAGNNLPFQGSYNNTLVLLMRTVEAFMARIKNFQMATNLFNGGQRKKQIAYFSLGWDVKNCIPGFIANMKSGNIPADTLKAHRIPDEFICNPDEFKTQIQEILIANTQYDQILKSDMMEHELAVARNVKTNLTRLSLVQLNSLIKHAENLTELQVRLYCPRLFADFNA